MNNMQNTPPVYLLVMLGLFALVMLTVLIQLVRPWLRAILHGTPVTLLQIVGMRLRGNPPSLLIDACVSLNRGGVSATIANVENVYIDHKNRVLTSEDLVEWVKKKPPTTERLR